jgi:uncharacterized membrane protein
LNHFPVPGNSALLPENKNWESWEMATGAKVPVASASVAGDLTLVDLRKVLAAGWADFRAFPQFGLFFASVYVAAGLFLVYAFIAWGEVIWLVPAAAGFPLLAPFIAVGLYEVSRRREAGLSMSWRSILGALRGRGDDQIIGMGVVLFVAFAFWVIVAHGVFYIFFAQSGLAAETTDFLFTFAGISMLLVGGAIGGLMALAFFAITVVSLPMLVDRDVDCISAIIVSLAAMRSNRRVLLAWALTIAVALFLAMLPMFLGLLVVLPVLAHATWHLYRRVASFPE